MSAFTRLHSPLSRPSLGGYLAPSLGLNSPSLGLVSHSPIPLCLRCPLEARRISRIWAGNDSLSAATSRRFLVWPTCPLHRFARLIKAATSRSHRNKINSLAYSDAGYRIHVE